MAKWWLLRTSMCSVPRSESPSLVAQVDAASTTIEFRTLPNTPIENHSLVFIAFFEKLNAKLAADARYTTKNGDTPVTVATGVTAAINDAAIPGVVATQRKAVSPLVGLGPIVDIVGANTGGAYVQCVVHAPVLSDPEVTLNATVSKAAGIIVVTLSGRVSSPHYGVFLNIYPGGVGGSFGVFVNPGYEQSLATIADALATSVNALPPAVRGTISATPFAATITIPDASAIECLINATSKLATLPTTLPFWRWVRAPIVSVASSTHDWMLTPQSFNWIPGSSTNLR